MHRLLLLLDTYLEIPIFKYIYLEIWLTWKIQFYFVASDAAEDNLG